MKISSPTSAQLAFRRGLEATIAEHGKTLEAQELLAVLSHLVGQVIALQDQATMTNDLCMELVGRNIEIGNREVVDGLLAKTGGHA